MKAGVRRGLLVTCVVAFAASQAPSRDADLCSKSIAQCRDRASRGDGGALYGLGLLHARGKHTDEGVVASMPETFKLWRRAADVGHILAMRDLAVLYHRGMGVAQSKSDAAHWFGLAAKQGDPESQYSLALLHGKGQGVERSMEKAAQNHKQRDHWVLPSCTNELHSFRAMGTAKWLGAPQRAAAVSCERVKEFGWWSRWQQADGRVIHINITWKGHRGRERLIWRAARHCSTENTADGIILNLSIVLS